MIYKRAKIIKFKMQLNNLSVVHGDGTTRNIATAINSFNKYLIELNNPELHLLIILQKSNGMHLMMS